MKAAILISGYLRTFELNIESINKIKSKFKEVDIFLHITNNESTQDKYMNNDYDIEFIKDKLNPKVIIVEDNILYSPDKNINNIFNLWFKYYKLNNLKIENEKNFGLYDIVIKYRPDLSINSDIDFNIDEDNIYIPEDSKIDKTKLLNPNDSYICDIFSYGSSKAMDKYFSIYNNIPTLIEKYGYVSETLLYHYLNDNNIKYKIIDVDYMILLSMCNVFAICGDSGSGKTTIGELLKNYFSNSFMLECDRYHKWERGDDNWKSVTHLNPDANYISKMNEDIFDLKIGKSIYQVDYDHHSGRFTEKEKIETSDNIIICGLHSLYSENEKLYDLKIFMDTDDNLKYKWKIKRDMSKRGYTFEKIMKQIEDRKLDYQKYIYPQREKSDVIINFFTDVEFRIDNIDTESPIYLRVLINKKSNIMNIISQFIKNDIIFDLEVSGDFNKLTFMEYKHSDIFNKTKLYNFYDYVIFILLNVDKNK